MTVALLLAASAARPRKDVVEEALLNGNELYSSGDLAGARAAYESCMQMDASNGLCMTNLASVLLDQAPDSPDARALAERLYRRVVSESGIVDGGLGADAAYNLALLLQDARTPAGT